MEDPNLIAYLYPGGDEPSHFKNAELTILMAQNETRRIEPLLVDRSRGSSLALEDGSDDYNDDKNNDECDGNDYDADDSYTNDLQSEETKKLPNHDYSPGLQLRFDDERKNRIGFVFGTSLGADIVLPRRDSMSGLAPRHCVLTFDDHGRLILRDLGDRERRKGGTAVTYGGKGGQKRRGFTWILSGHDFTEQREHEPIIIELDKNLKFEITIVTHDINSPLYKDNLAQFPYRAVTGVDDLSLGGLGFQSLDSTAVQSGAQTPSNNAILLDNGELGRGSQAVVVRVWDVSNAAEYASKQPLKTKFWDRLKMEVNLLKQINHENIVRCFSKYSTETPPRLVLEYVPLGNLEEQAEAEQISLEETLEILRQGLYALRYLHEREDPIVHRDIKPSNILVQTRNPLHIKLSDFGFSKENQDYLMTCCGTLLYAAPEVFIRTSYDASVDIWSLGVVVFEYAHGLPDYRRFKNFDGMWAKEIAKALNAEVGASHCPLLALLSRAMIVFDPESRYSAHRCWKEASQLHISESCCSTPTPAPYTREDEPTVVYNTPEEFRHQTGSPISVEGRLTAPFRDIGKTTSHSSSVAGYLTGLADNRRVRSGAPPPESFPRGQKRISQVSKQLSDRRPIKRRGHSNNAEMEQFFEMSSNPLHPLYAGSSLAEVESDWDETSQSSVVTVGGRVSEWASQDSYRDVEQTEPWPGSHRAPLSVSDGSVSDRIRFLGNLLQNEEESTIHKEEVEAAVARDESPPIGMNYTHSPFLGSADGHPTDGGHTTSGSYSNVSHSANGYLAVSSISHQKAAPFKHTQSSGIMEGRPSATWLTCDQSQD
ncbi:hypothetical protein GQX73_g4482 [Xylaria multiplex]|uniref:non-specific serine/threonine protein kinase n=1 Tax=Xylaria multiplex TaxID=323545 RepID=A0A7C8IVN0_9PEZI|nr:hypothetical protein GQX73_g4482 [Xylaria multiplex]